MGIRIERRKAFSSYSLNNYINQYSTNFKFTHKILFKLGLTSVDTAKNCQSLLSAFMPDARVWFKVQ